MEPKKRGFFYWILASCFVSIWVLPILATVLTSVKSIDELNQGQYWSFPEVFQWSNYYEAFVQGGFYKYFLNSFIITLPSVCLTLILASFNGYVLAKLRFKGRDQITLAFVSGMLLPFQILLIPIYYLSHHVLNIYDTRFGLVIFHACFQMGFASFFMRNFIRTLPTALIEAARIDGCSEIRIFFTTVLPLMRPALAALSTLLFTWIWNDFLWSLILLQSDEIKPITVALQNLKGQWVSSYHLQSAGAIIAAIPPVLVFAILQKHFIRGLTLGSTK